MESKTCSRILLLAIGLVGGLAVSCDSSGLSTSEMEAAAKQRVRQSLGITTESALFTNVFVGEPKDGDVVLCGIVTGETASGSEIAPHRFIAATGPARWIRFDTKAGTTDEIGATSTAMFVDEWARYCSAEQGI